MSTFFKSYQIKDTSEGAKIILELDNLNQMIHKRFQYGYHSMDNKISEDNYGDWDELYRIIKDEIKKNLEQNMDDIISDIREGYDDYLYKG